MIGAQVKSGESYFDRPTSTDDAVAGWVYRETNTEHLDHWLDHGLPHILVLYRDTVDQAYWVHVTAESVRRTGKGWKITVPADQALDESNRDGLLGVALSQRAADQLQGSLWVEADPPIAPGRLWRHALMAPRLVAPHRNAGFEIEIAPEQACALLVQGRQRDLGEFIKRGFAPSSDDPRAQEWAWAFAEQIKRYVTQDGFDRVVLVDLVREAETTPDGAAASVVLACSLAQDERHDEALEHLTRVIDDPDAAPADRAWCLAQRARFSVEVRRFDEARVDTIACQALINSEPADVTVSALSAVVAGVLWRTAGWEVAGVPDTLRSMDTAVSWWRSIAVGRGLGVFLDRSFESWTQSGGVRFFAEDSTAVGLEQASFLADFSGDQGSFSAAEDRAAMYTLVSGASEGDTYKALVRLRRAGAAKTLEAAARRLLDVGPLDELRYAVEDVRAMSWTASASSANLRLWAIAGDVASSEFAYDAVRGCLDALDGQGSMGLSETDTHDVHRAIAGLVAARPESADTVASRILPDASVEVNALVSEDTKRIVGRIMWDQVSEEARKRWLDAAQSDETSPELSIEILARLAAFDEAAVELIADRARTGDISAVVRMEAPRSLGDDVLADIVASLGDKSRQIVQQARNGSWGFGSIRVPMVLSWLNIEAPDHSDWPSVMEVLREATVAAGEKAAVLGYLLDHVGKLPLETRGELTTLIDDMEARAPSMGLDSNDFQANHLLLASELGAAVRVDTLRTVGTWAVSSESTDRTAAARVIGRIDDPSDEMIGLLVGLSRSSVVEVRSQVAESCGRLIARGIRRDLLEQCFSRMANQDGVAIPHGLLVGIHASATNERRMELAADLSRLNNHPSASIRRAAAIVFPQTDTENQNRTRDNTQ